MKKPLMSDEEIKILSLTEDLWDDLETLFGKSGAYWGCWCMYWRLSNKEFNTMSASDRKNALSNLTIKRIFPPGLLAYLGDIPVGWLGFGPRDSMERIVRSRVIPKVDDQPAWSIVCFFIHKDYRYQGISSQLLSAAKEYAKKQDIPILEAYPVDTGEEPITPVSAHCGILSVFERHQFEKVMDTKSKSGGKDRVIVRFDTI